MAGDAVRYHLRSTPGGGGGERGEGHLELEASGLTLTAPAGLPIRVPFREIVRVETGDHLLRFVLAGGEELELSHLGRRFDAVARTLTGLRRAHFDASLLLEEDGAGEEDRGAFRRRAPDGTAGPERTCALRPQRTSLAVLCEEEHPFAVPFGTVKDVGFDAATHAVVLVLWDGGALELLRLGKRTDAVRRALSERVTALAGRAAVALGALAPSLPALRVRALAAVLRDGVPASLEAVEAAAPGAWDAIWARSLAGGRRPYAEALAARAGRRWLCIKEVSGDAPEADDGAAGDDAATLPPECEGRRLLHAFELGPALVLEAPGAESVATYVFRAGPDPDARLRAVCRAFAAVQFRREPIHLADEALAAGLHARYREVVALVPEVREAREAFAGRAMHTSLEAWSAALDEAVANAR